MLKTKIHIPLEEYGFVEIEGEVEHIRDAVARYREAVNERDGGDGLPTHEWAKVRDSYVNTGGEIQVEDWERMGKAQRWFINELKKIIRKNK